MKEYKDKHNSVGFLMHSFKSFERIQKWGVETDATNSEKHYSIRFSRIPRTINLYSDATVNFDAVNLKHPKPVCSRIGQEGFHVVNHTITDLKLLSLLRLIFA